MREDRVLSPAFSTFMGGSTTDNDEAYSVALDSNGAFYLTGIAGSPEPSSRVSDPELLYSSSIAVVGIFRCIYCQTLARHGTVSSHDCNFVSRSLRFRPTAHIHCSRERSALHGGCTNGNSFIPRRSHSPGQPAVEQRKCIASCFGTERRQSQHYRFVRGQRHLFEQQFICADTSCESSWDSGGPHSGTQSCKSGPDCRVYRFGFGGRSGSRHANWHGDLPG